MDRSYSSRRGASSQAGLADEVQELQVDVGPFPHAVVGEEVLPARLLKLVARELPFELVVEVPELEVGEEVGVGVGELGVALVGRLLLLHAAARGGPGFPGPRR